MNYKKEGKKVQRNQRNKLSWYDSNADRLNAARRARRAEGRAAAAL
jgi:hypothetical protein